MVSGAKHGTVAGHTCMFQTITEEEKQQLWPRFMFSQYRVNLTLDSSARDFSQMLLCWSWLFHFVIGIFSTCSFSFSYLYFPLLSLLKNFTHQFSWQSESALWCSAASWFFQALQGRISQIDISCGSVPSLLGDSPEVQCCVARQTVKKRYKSLWPGELTCSPDKSKLMEKMGDC